MAGINREIWTGELVRRFTHEGEFLSAVPDYSRYAENDVIHLVDIGAKPDVLINNTTYPIALQTITDSDIAIGLDKFQTKVTPVTDDELYAISYNKIDSVITRHRESLQESTADKSAHALAPGADAAETPVIKTTGALDSGQRKMLPADLIALKRKLDALKVPMRSRNLILSTRHQNDLLEVDETFANQYKNNRTGEFFPYMGFNIFVFVNNPKYAINVTTKVASKVAYGAALAGTEVDSSVFFYGPNTFKAIGTTKSYFAEAANNPEYQRNLMNYRMHFVCLPKVQRGIAAIVSNYE